MHRVVNPLIGPQRGHGHHATGGDEAGDIVDGRRRRPSSRALATPPPGTPARASGTFAMTISGTHGRTADDAEELWGLMLNGIAAQ